MSNKYLKQTCLKARNISKFLSDDISYQMEPPGEWR